MHKNVAFGKQLGTAAPSCFSTILSSSSTTFNIFASLWWLKICRFPLVFSLLLKSGRFGLKLCEEAMEDHIKSNNFKKPLGAAVPSCFFKVHHAMFSRFFFIFSSCVSLFPLFSAFNVASRGVRTGGSKKSTPPKLYFPKSCSPLKQEALFQNLS